LACVISFKKKSQIIGQIYFDQTPAVEIKELKNLPAFHPMNVAQLKEEW
jgi:hypothetical protein